ncbi:MAG: radical SAM family heme chaperone HemW [Muribaculaceae bacterium]|nr:radical SAM family heme chaperone HemW [Muribaculaceae bacterium]
MAGIYIHIPFCSRKCIYCDFYSVGSRLADWSAYIDALLSEAKNRIKPARYNTIYIGGGTPSLIPAEEFSRLLSGILKLNTGKPEEITIEVNPDDVTPALALRWKQSGVTRVSMGVQTLIDSELNTIGRRHTAAQARNAFNILRPLFNNISLDVIFGLPGQTLDTWEETITEIIKMRPEHISAYSLMYEEQTAITRMLNQGKISETPECDSEKMFELLCTSISGAGYEHYEISNYALPGHRSLHNSSYWSGEPYIGLGPGAHSYDGRMKRIANKPDFRQYIAYWKDQTGEMPTEVEELTGNELREEMIMTRLRTREGLNLQEFGSQFGTEAVVALRRKVAPFLTLGHAELVNDRLALTQSGILISDTIISGLF